MGLCGLMVGFWGSRGNNYWLGGRPTLVWVYWEWVVIAGWVASGMDLIGSRGGGELCWFEDDDNQFSRDCS